MRPIRTLVSSESTNQGRFSDWTNETGPKWPWRSKIAGSAPKSVQLTLGGWRTYHSNLVPIGQKLRELSKHAWLTDLSQKWTFLWIRLFLCLSSQATSVSGHDREESRRFLGPLFQNVCVFYCLFQESRFSSAYAPKRLGGRGLILRNPVGSQGPSPESLRFLVSFSRMRVFLCLSS